MNLSNIAILNIKGSDYCSIISLISKNGATNLMQNADLTEKTEKLKFVDIGIKKQKFHQYKKLLIKK